MSSKISLDASTPCFWTSVVQKWVVTDGPCWTWVNSLQSPLACLFVTPWSEQKSPPAPWSWWSWSVCTCTQWNGDAELSQFHAAWAGEVMKHENRCVLLWIFSRSWRELCSLLSPTALKKWCYSTWLAQETVASSASGTGAPHWAGGAFMTRDTLCWAWVWARIAQCGKRGGDGDLKQLTGLVQVVVPGASLRKCVLRMCLHFDRKLAEWVCHSAVL